MRRRINSKRKQSSKKICSVVMAGMLGISLIAGNVVMAQAEEAETQVNPQSPRIVEDEKEGEENSNTHTVTYDVIEFGSYPQAEVVPSADKEVTVDESIRNGQDYEVNENVYNMLTNLDDSKWSTNGDYTDENGDKYRRITCKETYDPRYNVDCQFKWDKHPYFDMMCAEVYHYFKYEPIKWRVLEVDEDGQALLLADMVLDDQLYNVRKNEDVIWKTSTMRSFLNSYGKDENLEEKDYSETGFLTTAFNEAEQKAIQETEVADRNNHLVLSDEGKYVYTEDSIFLLSNDEMCGEQATKYGFTCNAKKEDPLKLAKGSTYAKARGIRSTDGGYCSGWWLRSMGTSFDEFMCVEDGKINSSSDEELYFGVRPAVRLSSLEGYAVKESPSVSVEHSYTWNVIEKATCVKEGRRKQVCACGVVGTTESISKDRNNHTGETEDINGYIYCKDCNGLIKEPEQQPSTDDDKKSDDTISSPGTNGNPAIKFDGNEYHPEKDNTASTASGTQGGFSTGGGQNPTASNKQQAITIAKISSYKAAKLKKKSTKIYLKAKAQGNLTYKVSKYPKKCKKYISVSKKGVVTLKKGIKKGTYQIMITAEGISGYDATTRIVSIKVK